MLKSSIYINNNIQKSTAVVVLIHTEPGKYSTERSNQFY